LFGLSAFTTNQRTKEIGIRKVLGATVLQLINLLSVDFIRLVIIAFVVAAPIAWYAMDQWLSDFAYRINIGFWVFVISGAAALLTALITVAFQTFRVANKNLINSLKTE
jgi:putative ABC transport system permease protein